MSGLITELAPTVVINGVQQYMKVHHLRILDSSGAEATTVPVPTDAPEIVDALADNIRASLREGYTLDY